MTDIALAYDRSVIAATDAHFADYVPTYVCPFAEDAGIERARRRARQDVDYNAVMAHPMVVATQEDLAYCEAVLSAAHTAYYNERFGSPAAARQKVMYDAARENRNKAQDPVYAAMKAAQASLAARLAA